MSDSAVISDDGRYRYVLTRDLGLDGEGTCLFVMLNPSTADERKNDPTLRRCIRFAQRWGYGKLVVGNLYALRATNPRVLRIDPAPIGLILPPRMTVDPETMVPAKTFEVNVNDEWLKHLCADPDLKRVICAWGNLSTHAQQERADHVLDILSHRYLPIKCLGLTSKGFPKHPLARGKYYVSYDDPPIDYSFQDVQLLRQAARAMDRREQDQRFTDGEKVRVERGNKGKQGQ